MKKTSNSKKTFLNVLLIMTTIIFSGCGSDSDPGGKFWWTFIGFPLLGIAYFVGGFAISIFQSKEDNANRDSPEPVPAIIVGIIILICLYSLFKATT